MTVTRDTVVAEARTWLGTPYRHQGRQRGLSVDCAGLVLGVASALGLCPDDFQDAEGYSRRPDGTLQPYCDRHMDRITVDEARAGDVVLFQWNGQASHMGILTGRFVLLHAWAINRRVCEHDMDDRWMAQVQTFYHVRGVE